MHRFSLFPLLLIVFSVSFALFADDSSEFISYDLHRYALVIGNGNYEEGAFANPKNDATLMSEKLASAGFDVYRYYDRDDNNRVRPVRAF